MSFSSDGLAFDFFASVSEAEEDNRFNASLVQEFA